MVNEAVTATEIAGEIGGFKNHKPLSHDIQTIFTAISLSEHNGECKSMHDYFTVNEWKIYNLWMIFQPEIRALLFI